MTDSPGKRSRYLQSLIGSDGKANFTQARGTTVFIVKCNYCHDPNPVGGTPMKRRIATGTRIREIVVSWMEHEASLEHDRARTSEPSKRRRNSSHGESLDDLMRRLTIEATAEIQAQPK